MAMKKSSSSSKKSGGMKKAQLGRAIKKLCGRGEDCASKGLGGYGAGSRGSRRSGMGRGGMRSPR